MGFAPGPDVGAGAGDSHQGGRGWLSIRWAPAAPAARLGAGLCAATPMAAPGPVLQGQGGFVVPGGLKMPGCEKKEIPSLTLGLNSAALFPCSHNGKLTKPRTGSAEVCRGALPASYQ